MSTPRTSGIAKDLASCVRDWQRTQQGLQAHCSYPASLGILAGHFPDRPLVPGVYCIGLVLHLLDLAGISHRLPYHIRRSKLARPILPEQPFSVELTLSTPSDTSRRIVARFRSPAPQATELARLELEVGA